MTKADQILTDPSASYWLKEALRSALERDPVDVVNDMEALAAALAEWAEPEPFSLPVIDPAWIDKQHMAAHAINHDWNCTHTTCGHLLNEFCVICEPRLRTTEGERS